ncbi:DedA family protein [Candidatus Cytomitobacter indipagum]|uniref:DedA family protein n=1 Tax=Candidatus Cytomitobacter indipagum TaxID=2601575 RepID=A0A5C0UD94_9PROT|nr:DedA family protein [Candidatus Cytomitobacter indipagum]QEK38006.1 DedA family protein [Candidatus Cytomitobacter indipagum]
MLIDLVQNYGYWIVLFGSMIEGESIVLTAGMLCAHGVLSFYKICILSFIGTCVADQLLYNLGYYIGPGFLERFSFSRKLFTKLKPLAIKYQNTYILSFRFIYGIRIISPVLIGIIKIDPKKYMILNIIASVIWAVISCAIGYAIGAFTKSLDFNFKYLMIAGTLMILLLLLISKLIANHILKKNNIN